MKLDLIHCEWRHNDTHSGEQRHLRPWTLRFSIGDVHWELLRLKC